MHASMLGKRSRHKDLDKRPTPNIAPLWISDIDLKSEKLLKNQVIV